jgi:hypothetical protein
MFLAPWMVLWPGLALSVVVYGTHMFGDALRDILDPRLRGGAGRYGVRQGRRARGAGPDGRSAKPAAPVADRQGARSDAKGGAT